MIKVGIIGGSGYAGQNIIKLLLQHKNVEIKMVVSTSLDGENEPLTGLKYSKLEPDELNKMDVVFLSTPHGTAKEICEKLNTRVIDMSADHRCTNTYGLPEVFKEEIKDATLVGNPGCYATANILSVYPIKEYIDYVVFDCISGYSGGGKNAKDKFDYEENIIAYQLTKHFHINEMEKILKCSLSFTPHVVNAFSGLMCTAHVFLKKEAQDIDIKKIYQEFYKNTFTRIVEGIPQTKDVINTPYCNIGGFEKDKNNQIIIVSVIDNLQKGAASQAVQNMNIMFGFNEYEGLEL